MFKTLGASNHTDHERAWGDYYATEPKAVEWLLKLETLDGPVLEPACGEDHISEALIRGGIDVTSRDLIDRGYGEVSDFLAIDNQEWNGHIVTNPPYAYAQEFVEKALQIVPDGKKVCMFLKLTFLEGKARKHLFRTQPPRRVRGSCSRLLCAMNGKFDEISGSATAYAWFVWEKGWTGPTEVKWFN